MTLARIRGTIVADKRSDGVANPRFLLIEDCDQRGEGRGEFLVALDLVGADRGHLVLVTQGSSCRGSSGTADKPIDCLIVAIVDSIDQQGVDVWVQD